MPNFTKKSILEVIDFHDIFLLTGKAHPIYAKLYNTISKKVIHTNNKGLAEKIGKKIFIIQDTPSYINAEIPANINLKKHTIKLYKGFFIGLGKYKDRTHFLNSVFSSKKRSQLKKYQKRLEASFPITYKIYYGDISKHEYDYIFEEFREMLTKRFKEKRTKNVDLPLWDKYYENIYPLILAKKACLSIIYNGSNPISISLNMVFDKIVFGYIKAYDIDYSKFCPGFIDLINVLEWCFENDFEVLDFLKGEYDYKTKWTDGEYFFQRHIVYNSSTLFSRIYARYLVVKTNGIVYFVNFIQALNITALKNKITLFFNPKPPKRKTFVEKIDHLPIAKPLIEIAWETEGFYFLKKPINDFLYTYKESIKDITIYKIRMPVETYIISGKNNHQKIIRY